MVPYPLCVYLEIFFFSPLRKDLNVLTLLASSSSYDVAALIFVFLRGLPPAVKGGETRPEIPDVIRLVALVPRFSSFSLRDDLRDRGSLLDGADERKSWSSKSAKPALWPFTGALVMAPASFGIADANAPSPAGAIA